MQTLSIIEYFTAHDKAIASDKDRGIRQQTNCAKKNSILHLANNYVQALSKEPETEETRYLFSLFCVFPLPHCHLLFCVVSASLAELCKFAPPLCFEHAYGTLTCDCKWTSSCCKSLVKLFWGDVDS